MTSVFDNRHEARVVVTVPGGGTACADAVRFGSTTYLYDIASRLSEVDDNGILTQYYYDTIGRISSVRDPQARDVEYAHDDMHRRSELTYPDSSFITYDYDEMGRLTDIKQSGTTVLAHYDYDELSRRTLLTYNNGTSAGYDYEDKPASDDNLGNRLEQIDNNINGTYVTFDYTYDAVGNRLSEIADGTPHDYVYDDIYQLTDVDTGAITYSYNSVGNRLTMDDGTSKTYASNNLNQYTTNIDGTYSYNSNGNLTGDSSYTYDYDSQNHLVSIASLAVYEYDWLGRRISKTTGGVTTEYVYDGDQVIAEYDDSVTQGTFVLVRKYIYGPRIDEPIIMVVKGTPDQYYYYHFDGLDSVVALSDDTGTIVERYEYSEYGQTQIMSASYQPRATSNYNNPYMFTGRRFDAETGLYYYRARMYHPELGRFMQPDPIGYLGGMNMYAYVGNNPVNWIDPYGLESGLLSTLWEGWRTGSFRGYGGLFGMEFEEAYVKGTAAWADGVIPIWNPFEDVYSDECDEYKFSRAMGHISRDAAIFAFSGPQNLGMYLKNPKLYEAGSVALSNANYAKYGLEGLNAVQKGTILYKRVGGFWKIMKMSNLAKGFQLLPTGLTLGAGLATIGIAEGADALSDGCKK